MKTRAGKRARSILMGLFAAVMLAGTGDQSARAEGVADFYKGKTITVYVAVGKGAYDLYARHLIRHMPKFIAGQPNMIVSNMPGGGGVVAANFAANVAAKDGTALLVPLKPVAMTQLLNPDVKYDASKFQWVGSMVDAPGALMVWHTAPVKTLEDARRQTVALGSTGWGGETAIFPSVINSVLGTKFKVIAGFSGMSNIFLGMEREELHGVSTVYGSVKGLKSEWLAGNKVRFIVQVSEKRIKDLPDVPTVLEFAKSDEDRRILRFLTLSNVIGRSIAAPPGVPRDRLAALRKAFDDAVASAAFLAETRDKNVEINPTSGSVVQKDVDQLYATPKATIDKVRAIVSTAASGKP